jgi:hypothetical protein
MHLRTSRYTPLLAFTLFVGVSTARTSAEQLFVRKAAGQGYYVGTKNGSQLDMIEGVGPVGTVERNGRLLYVWEGISSSRRFHTPLPPGAAPAGDPLAKDNALDMVGAAWANGLAALATMDVPVVDPETWGAAADQDGDRTVLRVLVLSDAKEVQGPKDVKALDWAVHLGAEGIEDGFFWDHAKSWRIVEISNYSSNHSSWYFADTPVDQRYERDFFEYGWGRGSIFGDVNIRTALAGDEFQKSLFGNGKTFAIGLEILSEKQREYVEANWWGRFTARISHGIDQVLGDGEPEAEDASEQESSLFGQGS